MSATRKTLVIVGAGPSCTYVLERLASRVLSSVNAMQVDIHIFDRSGEFGAGAVHSSQQPRSSFLNRIAGQVAFAADESVEDAGQLLPRNERMPLDEWCRSEFARTGEEDFDLQPEDWPKRYVHGRALRHNFEHFCSLLSAHPGIRLELHHDEVVDLIEEEGVLSVYSVKDTTPIAADHVLFLTGHSSNDPMLHPRTRELAQFAEHTQSTYVPSAYPLEKNIPLTRITPRTVIACDGSGLTTLDIILYLTEGQGGIFTQTESGHLRYSPSGREPMKIIPVSNSGLFTFARPFNAKEADLERFEHRGVFLTHETINRLRAAYGVTMDLGRLGVRKQLDFESTVWPVMILEMAFLSYRTLLGESFGESAKAYIQSSFDAFVDGGAVHTDIESRTLELCGTLQEFFEYAAKQIDSVLEGGSCSSCDVLGVLKLDFDATLKRFLSVVYGNTVDVDAIVERASKKQNIQTMLSGIDSPYQHALRASDHGFSWPKTISPIEQKDCDTPERYHAAMVRFMHRDCLWAAQNNLMNPAKAAADGVWRDLRQTLAYAADFGGFTAASHRAFLDTYMRHHNRLCNGAALEVMEKMMALIDFGLLDVSVGPRARFECDEDSERFRIVGAATGACVLADCVIDSRVHPFDPCRDVLPLYRRLLERGWVRKWVNPGVDGDFAPGGLDLTQSFHPIRDNGIADERLTFLGPPTEGIMFFQLGALRPNQNHHVMEDILRWLSEFWDDELVASNNGTEKNR